MEYAVSKPLLSALLLSTLAIACANDAELSYGGSARRVAGSNAVRMLRERVVMDVTRMTTKVHCDFWFRNDGALATIKMGFPDEGTNTEEFQPGAKPASNFAYFKSWVEGRPVATRFSQGEDRTFWHVKTVRFPHGVTHVRDEYAMDTGYGIMEAARKTGNCSWTRYTVHTGSTWKGAIGETVIVVRFSKKEFSRGIKLLSPAPVDGEVNGRDLRGQVFPSKNSVVCKGVSRPRVSGTTLTFRRTNWRPAEKDDLNIWFGYRHG
ncbi:MAG TPA: hypothetical protein VG944_04885 [Fimbriimonas sp.]|nr:hypothetical protein [Fimbriimonas sp.]